MDQAKWRAPRARRIGRLALNMTTPRTSIRQPSESPWRGRIRVGDHLAVFVGVPGDAARHAHHAHQIVFSRGDGDGLLVEGATRHDEAWVVPSGVLHRVHAGTGPATFIYAEPLHPREPSPDRKEGPTRCRCLAAVAASGVARESAFACAQRAHEGRRPFARRRPQRRRTGETAEHKRTPTRTQAWGLTRPASEAARDLAASAFRHRTGAGRRYADCCCL